MMICNTSYVYLLMILKQFITSKIKNKPIQNITEFIYIN